jgi:hypothetical protein
MLTGLAFARCRRRCKADGAVSHRCERLMCRGRSGLLAPSLGPEQPNFNTVTTGSGAYSASLPYVKLEMEPPPLKSPARAASGKPICAQRDGVGLWP